MRISMISTLPPIKGLTPYTLTLVKALAERVEIDFFGFKALYPEFLYPGGTRTQDPEPVIPNVRIRNLLTWYNPFSWLWAGVSIRTDIVHAQWWSWFLAPVYLVVLAVARLRRKRVILTVHNVNPHERAWWKRVLNSSVLRLASEYIVHNEGNRELFLKETGTKKAVHVIPHPIIGIDGSTVPRDELRSRYGYTQADRVVLYFGNIRDYKGLDVLIEAFAALDNPESRLIIAGRPWKNFDHYAHLIDKMGVGLTVKLFLEFISNSQVAELFKLADVVVFPYKEFDASSGAGSLALQFEKATVVTDVGGLPELVSDPKLVVRPSDVRSLVGGITYALNNQNRLEGEMVQLKEKFSPERIARMHLELYSTMP